MKRMSTNPNEYVVFDVETNGLKSKQNDLLSIAFYKPDDGKKYSRFLPLELNRKIVTTRINGITEADLKGATALTQRDFDYIVESFELEKRIILIYAGRDFDASFLAAYMKRHRIRGFEKLKFYNFKRNILSSRFSTGNITKDNLCFLFGVKGVQTVHSGLNDCLLEWQLFEKMGGFFYLVTEGEGVDNVFRLTENYIIPASLLSSHPNLSRLLNERPYIECKSTLIKSYQIDAEGIEKFPTNFTGMTIEHLINTMLNVDKQNSIDFLLENKRKLDYIGGIPNGLIAVPMVFNPDGTITACHKEDKKLEKRINSTGKNLVKRIQPLIDFIKCEIFQNEHILSQELVVDSKNNILALCDLSSKNVILEIKTNNDDSLAYKEQLFYEAKGRKVYHLRMEWVKNRDNNLLEMVVFRIFSVDVHIGNPSAINWVDGKRAENRSMKIAEIKKHLASTDISLISFTNASSPITLQCTKCGCEWTIRYTTLMKKIPDCPKCKSKITDKEEHSKKDYKKIRADKYYERILQKSNHTLVAFNYIGAKNDVDVICVTCGYKWKSRADHLFVRCYCPKCKKENIHCR